MTLGSSFFSTASSFPAFLGRTNAAPRVNFGSSVDAPERNDIDQFVRNTDAQPSETTPPQPDSDWDEFVQNHEVGKPNGTDGPDETPPEEETPPDIKLGDVEETTDDDEEKPEDFVAKLLSDDKIKPLEINAPTASIVQSLRGTTSQQLKQVLSRSHLNSAVLTYDDDRLKDGILAKLRADLPEATMLTVDCEGIEPKKGGGFFNRDKKEHHLAKTLEDVIPQLSEKFNLPENNGQPLVLILEKANGDELGHLQESKVYKEFQQKFPNVRFVIPTSTSDDESGSSKSSLSWMDNDNGSSGQPWRAGQFQIVNIPTLKPQEWSKVLKGDPFAQNILNFWDLDASEEILGEFFSILKKEDPDTPLTYEGLVAEIDSLGSFINPEVNCEDYPVTSRHLKTYTHKVLAARRGSAPTAGGPASMGPAPYDVINSGDINVRMTDVIGHDKAKKVLMQSLQEAKYPQLFDHINGNDPDAAQSTVLLLGDPGSGKTMLAKALASSGGATFISTSGARFVNGLVGGGANAIRRLRDGIEQAPDDLVVVFIDEIDALGSRSGIGAEGGGASGSEDLKTINEFLAFTDGVKKSSKRVLLVGATNRADALDPAILSRFNYKLEIASLDKKQRYQLIQHQMKQKNMHPDDSVDLDVLSSRTNGFSGRDIRNMMKIIKDRLISNLSTDTMDKLEQDETTRNAFKLVPSHRDFMYGIREVKKGKRKTEAPDSGSSGPRKYGTATL